ILIDGGGDDTYLGKSVALGAATSAGPESSSTRAETTITRRCASPRASVRWAAPASCGTPPATTPTTTTCPGRNTPALPTTRSAPAAPSTPAGTATVAPGGTWAAGSSAAPA